MVTCTDWIYLVLNKNKRIKENILLYGDRKGGNNLIQVPQ